MKGSTTEKKDLLIERENCKICRNNMNKNRQEIKRTKVETTIDKTQ